jgi:sortase A
MNIEVKKMKKVLSILLILAGVTVFFYPAIHDLYTSYSQKQMIDQWEENALKEYDASNSLDQLEEVFSVETKAQNNEKEVPAELDGETLKEVKSSNPGIIGIIEIDKIHLKLPILNGASMANLDIGAGLLEGTAQPGNPGNSAIAAHRSRAYGKMFNRLDELAAGDIVTVKDKGKVYTYKVYETLVVQPDDVSVLNGSSDEKTLTLITCTPIETGTHRLIIKAKIQP